MTASIKEALEAALSFLDGLAENAEPGARHPLNSIIIGKGAAVYADQLRAALASLSCGEARERIARIIDAYSRGAFTGWKGKTGDSKITLDEAEDHFTLCMQDLKDTILATGCVPGEASIRADERAKCEKNDLLDAMQAECWTLRCVDIPTGCGDADVAWEVVQHHMAKPHDRVIATGSTPREALAAAIRAGRGEG